MRLVWFTIVGVLMSGCGDKDAADDSGGASGGPCSEVDADGDGIDACTDCDDADPEQPTAWYFDQDFDGWGVVSAVLKDCTQPAGYSASAGDCDDNDDAVYPGAPEDDCTDPKDYNCDGEVDYIDGDGDGAAACEDCDDADATRYPGAEELWYDGVDGDCSDDDDFDADGDGYASSDFGGQDCDDSDAGVSPAGAETWYDGVDGDCDGGSDFDADVDGSDSDAYGGADCDDTDDAVHPGAEESWYDGVDSDCSGGSDYDADMDGSDSDAYGGDDCDDADASVFPSAVETWYDGVDGDCSGGSDYDADGDGADSSEYGGDDCDDEDESVYAGAVELLGDDVDEDCDGIDAYYWDDFESGTVGEPVPGVGHWVCVGDSCVTVYAENPVDADDIVASTAAGSGEIGVETYSFDDALYVRVMLYDPGGTNLAYLRMWDRGADCLVAEGGVYSDGYGATCEGGAYAEDCTGSNTSILGSRGTTAAWLELEFIVQSSEGGGLQTDVCVEGRCLSDEGEMLATSCTEVNEIGLDDPSLDAFWDDFFVGVPVD